MPQPHLFFCAWPPGVCHFALLYLPHGGLKPLSPEEKHAALLYCLLGMCHNNEKSEDWENYPLLINWMVKLHSPHQTVLTHLPASDGEPYRFTQFPLPPTITYRTQGSVRSLLVEFLSLCCPHGHISLLGSTYIYHSSECCQPGQLTWALVSWVYLPFSLWVCCTESADPPLSSLEVGLMRAAKPQYSNLIAVSGMLCPHLE